MKGNLILTILVGGILVGASPEFDDIPVGDSLFSVSPKNLEENEMSANVKQISSTVMGIAEFVVDIRSDLQEIKEVLQKPQRFGRSTADSVTTLDDPERVKKNYEIAAKLEKFFVSDLDPQLVEKTKEELKKTMEVNFVKILSAMLISKTMRTQEKTEDILTLMKSTLNGELDFGPVVDKLPFIMRDSETKQFIHLLNVLNEGDLNKKFRQSDNDDDEDSDNPVEDNKPATVQALKPVIQQSIAPQQVVRQQQQLGGQGIRQVQGQANYQPQKGVYAPVNANAVQQAPVVQQSQGGQIAQAGNGFPPIQTALPVAAVPQPIILQLAQPPAPTSPPQKTRLQMLIEVFNTISVSQIAEIASRIPDLFEGVAGLIGGLDII